MTTYVIAISIDLELFSSIPNIRRIMIASCSGETNEF